MSGSARIDIETLRELLRLDPETGVLYWRGAKSGRKDGVAGYVTEKGYSRLTILKKNYPAHRVVWALHYGVWPEDQIDHINGNRADNRIENLREATQAENCRNRGARLDNTSGYKGVSFHGATQKFRAEIRVGGPPQHLGLFLTAEAAHEAYKDAAAKYHGELFNAG